MDETGQDDRENEKQEFSDEGYGAPGNVGVNGAQGNAGENTDTKACDWDDEEDANTQEIAC